MKPTEYMRIPAMALLLVVSGLAGQAQGLQLTAGVHWVENGPCQLILYNASLINNGSYIADSGTVVFAGDGRTPAFVGDVRMPGAFIGGANPTAFYNLTIGSSANDLQLNNNAAVTGRVTLDSGNLQLNGYLLDLGSTGNIAGERNESRITGERGGTIRVSSVLNSPHAVNPGNIGIEITSEGNLGTTVISRGHYPLTNPGGETSIQRWFDIVPETNTNLHASVRLFFLEGELAGKDKNELTLFSGVGTNGALASRGKDATDLNANWILKSNIDQLYRFTLAIGPDKVFSNNSRTITSMQIYPTPVHNTFTLQIVSKENGNGVLSLYDPSGHLIEEKRGYWQAGVTTMNWNIGRYAAGIYYLKVGDLNDGTLIVVKQ